VNHYHPLVRTEPEALQYRQTTGHAFPPEAPSITAVERAIIRRVEPARSFEVSPSEAGERLDVWLARALSVSRGYARKLLSAERVRVSGRTAVKGIALRAGERVEVEPFARPEAGALANSDLPLVVVAESDGLVAIDKPAGWPTHPLDPEERDTALNAFVARYPQSRNVGEAGLRGGVVHRLDPGTSGVLLFAHEETAWRRARAAFAEKRVNKRYLARVHGDFVGEREVSLRLENRGARVRVVASGGREAVSWLRALRRDATTTLIEIQMRTGVRHQIRASLAHLGHPIVGDSLYGSTLPLARHLLHAESLAFEDFSARAPVPPEIESGLG
jgi:23S rRNA pseudouridine1911/1915/1917 synthase